MKKINKKTIIPSIGTLVILSSLIIYIVLSAVGIVENPFFDGKPLGNNKEIQSSVAEDVNKNAPKNTWNLQALELSPEQISQSISNNVAILKELSPFVSITIKDAVTNKTLYSLNDKTANSVASATKLLSMIASIEELGENYQFTTKTSIDKNNNLYLYSNGDILLNAQNSDLNNVNGYAGLKTLAEETAKYLQKNNIKTINLNIDDTYFGNEKTLSSWAEQKSESYIGKVIPMAINTGFVNKSFSETPEKVVSETFATHLQNLGIQVNQINEHKKTPKIIRNIANIKSDKLKNIIKHTLKESDNTTAETISRAAAIKAGYKPTFKDTTRFIKNTLKNLDIDTADLSLEDASGLSRNSKITTTTLTSALEKTFVDNVKLFEIYNSLPISGTDGTLKQRLTNIPGKVLAKTGTLPQTSSLSGVVFTNSGRTLSFSISATNFDEKTFWNVRQNIDILVETLQKQ